MMGVIKRTFEFLNCNMFNLRYMSMVRSHLESAVCVWYPYKIKDMTQIETVQRKGKTKKVKFTNCRI